MRRPVRNIALMPDQDGIIAVNAAIEPVKMW